MLEATIWSQSLSWRCKAVQGHGSIVTGRGKGLLVSKGAKPKSECQSVAPSPQPPEPPEPPIAQRKRWHLGASRRGHPDRDLVAESQSSQVHVAPHTHTHTHTHAHTHTHTHRDRALLCAALRSAPRRTLGTPRSREAQKAKRGDKASSRSSPLWRCKLKY